MARIVIACYKPKPGRQKQLEELARQHYDHLRKENLVTDRKPILMKAENGTVVEVFEWESAEAVEAAHTNEAVKKLWERFAEISDYLPVGQVPEAQQLFSEFEAI